MLAQERADAGDPDYTWQVDPSWSSDDEPLIGTEISERFLREGLGWEEFMPVGSAGYVAAGGPDVNAVVFFRCAPGRTNPLASLYPDMDPEIRGCAPTLDDFRYETVLYTVGQPARRGPSGIWVVTAWEMLQPGEQAAPPSDADVTALLQAFLGARVDGEGAEEYLLPDGEAEGLPFVDGEAPLLHATTGGSRYERSEIERVQGPVWPAGWIEFKVRLFAEDGTVVEQHFVVVRQDDGRLGLVYGSASEYGDPPTIENAQALYSLLDGEVTFAAAASPWRARLAGPTSMNLGVRLSGDRILLRQRRRGGRPPGRDELRSRPGPRRRRRARPEHPVQPRPGVDHSGGGERRGDRRPADGRGGRPGSRRLRDAPGVDRALGCGRPTGCACIWSTSPEGRLGCWPSR